MIWKSLSNHLSHWKVEELFSAACSAQCSMLRTGRLRSETVGLLFHRAVLNPKALTNKQLKIKPWGSRASLWLDVLLFDSCLDTCGVT